MTCKKHYNWNTDAPCPYCRIDELERMLRMKQEDWISACNEAQVLKQQLVEAQSELILSIKERIELGGKLSRYQGRVEVEGYIDLGGELHINRKESLKFKGIHGDARVLVIPKEVE